MVGASELEGSDADLLEPFNKGFKFVVGSCVDYEGEVMQTTPVAIVSIEIVRNPRKCYDTSI